MYVINFSDTLLAMAAILFLIGLLMLVLGIFVLISRAMSRDLRAMTAHTARLAGKGIADDMSGLVGNASALLASLTSMVRTAAGIGIFLTISGMILMGSALWMVTQVEWPL